MLDAYAWPGGYPIMYLVDSDGAVLCPPCANDEKAPTAFIYWEGPPIQCDECRKRFCSAYGETA